MAGCFDSDWRVGSKARGTRSQFKLATEGLLPFKCTYPVHLTDVMEGNPSPQSDLRRGELLSPIRGTRTLAVREYEEAIEELRKENFDLKLKRFLLEQHLDKLQKNKNSGVDDVQVVVELQVQTETLKLELNKKDQLLQAALDRAEQCEFELKEQLEKFTRLQEQSSSAANVPQENDQWLFLKDENESFERETKNLKNVLSEKDQIIQNANAEIAELNNAITALEIKAKKSSLAIQGLVNKYYTDIEVIPKELRPIVQDAMQAAKECKEEELNAAIGEFKATLCQIMPSYVHKLLLAQEQKENKNPSGSKTSLSKLLNVPKASVSVGESSLSSSSKTKFVNVIKEQSPTKVKNLSQSSESIMSASSVGSENFEEMINVLKENDNLKADNEEKERTIQDLNATCNELERRTIQLQSELSEAVSRNLIQKLETKAREKKSKSTSSSVQCNLMQSKLCDSFLQSVGQSNNVDELREEILRLMLIIEQKDKEVSDIEQEFGSLQKNLEKMESQKTNSFSNLHKDIDDIVERNELHRRLALSCQINHELMGHLRKLETFMEDLLLNKNLDSSSVGNLSDASDILSHLTACLDETKKLSDDLSDQLSVCESSKLFDPSEISMTGEEYNQSKKQSYSADHSRRLSLDNSNTHSTSQGRNNLFQSESSVNTAGTGKRRLSFSTLHNSARSRIDLENAVVLGTSNNEDLILLLNEQGDPKDVLIRNNHSQLDQNLSELISQHPRRCLDTSAGFWNLENPQWGADEMLNPKMLQNRGLSSDSDIWSEPDRDVSLQRIGIDVQKSPVAQKSPRRLRLRDKRTTDELSSQKYESSSSAVKFHSWSKRRKCSEALRSSFICKKCSSQSPSKESTEKDRLQKVVNELSNKCSKQENQLDKLKENLDCKIEEIDALNKEKLELANCTRKLEKDLEELKVKRNELALQSSESTSRVMEVSSENDKLRLSMEKLEAKATESDVICKKLKEELEQTKSRLENLDRNCSKYANDLSSSTKSLDEYKEKYNSVEKEKDKLSKEIQELVSTKNELLQSIQLEKDKIRLSENQKDELKQKLKKQTKSFSSLQSQYEEFKTKSEEILREKEGNLLSSKSACEELKEKLKETAKMLEEHKEEYNIVEKEKDRLSKEIQDLVSSKNELVQSIQLEKDKVRLFENQVASLQSQCGNLLSYKSACEELKEKLKKAHECSENLKQVCTTYEKVSHDSLEVKETLIGFLLKVKSLFLYNLQNLTDMCKQFFDRKEEENFRDIDNSLSRELSTTDKDVQMEKLFNDIITINTKLEQEIKFLSDQLGSVRSIQQHFEKINKEIQSLEKQNSLLKNHVKTLQATENEGKSVIKESESKIDFLQQNLSNAQKDIKTLKEREKDQQTYVEGIEQVLKDREKSIEELKVMLSSSEKQLNSMQKQAEKEKGDLLHLKTVEISKLQDEVVRIKSQLLEILEEKAAVVHQARFNSSQSSQESVSTISPSKGYPNVSERSISREATNKCGSTENIAASFSSSTSFNDEVSNKKRDEYIKKIKSLKIKLAINKNRCEMLEKEKSDLRAELLAQVQRERTANQSSEEVDGLRKDLSDLKEKLEAKSSFIKDLKCDMYKTCNALVDKQKEVDNLKRKLSDSKEQCTEVKYTAEDSSKGRYSDPLHTDVEANIKMLKKQKWELIQSILDQQKQFYERKNIHLGHLDKFKNHIERLRAIQVSPALFRSASTPLSNSFTAENVCYAEKCDNTLKNLKIELEMDVECLNNFKIFFKRFFIPLVLQSCEQCLKNIDSSPKHSLNEIDKSENFTTSSTEVAHYRSEHSFSDRLISTAFAVAQKIDSIENILKSVKHLLENFKESSSVKETPKKNAAVSLLDKLSVEISTLHEKADKIFHLNSVLKSLGLFDATLSQSRSKQDISDRESLSEETITISRSGSLSPMSFEDNLPFQTFSNNSERRKSTAGTESYANLSHKSNVAGGSQESIFQRSHFSSPDLGIESDANHESSAPEQAEKEELMRSTSRRHESSLGKVWSVEKQAPVSVRSVVDSSLKSKVSDHANASGDSLHAICLLPHYELLKKEVHESLVGIKSLLSRTNDGLQNVSKFTSPRKNLEHTTFKAIRDTGGNIEVCLEEARKLVDKFWISPCPSVQQLNALYQQNQENEEKLKKFHESKIKQDAFFKEAIAKLKNDQLEKEQMEKRIAHKLVKTKKVLRQAESKLLEQGSQELPKIPKYPMHEPTCQK